MNESGFLNLTKEEYKLVHDLIEAEIEKCLSDKTISTEDKHICIDVTSMIKAKLSLQSSD